MKGKDWVAILVSIAALVISAGTAYFSLVRQSEQLRVFVGDAIPFLTRTDDGRLQLEGNLDIAFMNTGTRPIIVLSVDLVIDDIPEGKDGGRKSCDRIFGGLPFDVDSFVVKEKESVAKLLKLRFDPRRPIGNAKSTEDGRIVVPAPKNSRGEPSRFVGTCLRIGGATPSRQPLVADIPIGDFEWPTQGPAVASRYWPTPTVIWTKLGTIFSTD
jgi:hypothetical protein